MDSKTTIKKLRAEVKSLKDEKREENKEKQKLMKLCDACAKKCVWGK